MFRKLFSLSKLNNNLNVLQNNSRNYVRKVNRHRLVQNPGLQHQMEAHDDPAADGNRNSSEFHQLNDPNPETFGDYESDFMNVHKTHTQHEREMRDKQEEIKHRIIGKKYFKQKQLNFLTWSEKQQIRHLNDTDSHEWTIDRLSESFPATPEIVQKILRAKWLPNDTQRIIKHDENVKKNWESFRDGANLESMPLHLREHLRKFSERNWTNDRPTLTAKHYIVEKRSLPMPTNLEFTNIITSCEKYNKQQIEDNLKLADFNDDNHIQSSSVSITPPADDTTQLSLSSNIMENNRLMKMSTNSKNKEMFMLNTKPTNNEHSNRKLITFRELQLNSNEYQKDDIDDDYKNNARTTETIKERTVTSNNFLETQSNRTENYNNNNNNNNNNIDLAAVNKLKNPQGTGIIKQTKKMINGNNHDDDDDDDEMNKIILKKFDNIEIQLGKNDLNELTIPSIRDRIRIPKKLHKKGATYKLEDCYYDDDGSFLYRTPGMC